MAVSQGFDITRVLQVLKPRLGWRNPTIEGFTGKLDNASKESTSGRYFDEFHAVVSAANVWWLQPDPKISDANFNAKLAEMEEAAILAALGGVFNAAQPVDSSSMLWERIENSAFDARGNQGHFVGWRLRIAAGYTGQIHSLSLFFNAAATFNVYLYADLKKAPLKTQSVTTIAEDQVIVPLTDWTITAQSTTGNGTLFYLGYFENDTAGAKPMEFTFCQSCFKAIGAEAVSCDVVAPGVFSREMVSYSYETYGLNLELSTYRDLTSKVVASAHVFDELVGLHMAARVIEDAVYSVRSDQIQRILGGNLPTLLADLNRAITTDEQPWVIGIRARIRKETARIQAHFQEKNNSITVTVPR